MASSTDSTQPVKYLRYPIRRKNLLDIYQIDRGVLITWFEEIGITHARTPSPKEIVTFINTYGWPSTKILPLIPNVKIEVQELPLFKVPA